jgi:hypothetical protein
VAVDVVVVPSGEAVVALAVAAVATGAVAAFRPNPGLALQHRTPTSDMPLPQEYLNDSVVYLLLFIC